MIDCRCVKRDKDTYVLQFPNGSYDSVSSYELKESIKCGYFNVINLALTADNKLISYDNSGDITLSPELLDNLIIHRRKRIQFTAVDSARLRTLVSKAMHKSGNGIVDIKKLSDRVVVIDTNGEMAVLLGCKRIVLPADCSNLFSLACADHIDLTNCDWGRVRLACKMFGQASSTKVVLGDTSKAKIVHAEKMFECSRVQEVNLGGFDFISLGSTGMFSGTTVQHVVMTSNAHVSKTDALRLLGINSDCVLDVKPMHK